MSVVEGVDILRKKALDFATLVSDAGLVDTRLPWGYRVVMSLDRPKFCGPTSPLSTIIDIYLADPACDGGVLRRFRRDIERGYEARLLAFVRKHDQSPQFEALASKHRSDMKLSEYVAALGMDTDQFIRWAESRKEVG